MVNYKEKICKICGKTFKPNSSTQKYCLECGILKNKYYFSNKEKCNIRHKEWLSNNKEQQKNYKHKYYNDNLKKEKERNKCYYYENKELFKIKAEKFKKANYNYQKVYMKKWHATHIEHEKQYTKRYRKDKYKKDINFKLGIWCRRQIFRSIKHKDKKTFNILDYTPQQLKQRLEFQFKNGMNWDNYGTYWVVHHKKELHKFNFGDKDNINYEQIRIANSLANLQPITIEEHKLIHSKQKG